MEQEEPENLGPLLAQAESLGQAFLLEFFEARARSRPDDVGALAELGHLYTRLGRHAEGLEVDLRLVALAPEDETARYNLACSLALLGQTDRAFAELARAIELGYDDAELLAADGDLANLRDDPRFAELVAQLGGADG